ncbi:TolC family protein, partial [bacterium]|nr:TolC family protein [bacterium]
TFEGDRLKKLIIFLIAILSIQLSAKEIKLSLVFDENSHINDFMERLLLEEISNFIGEENSVKVERRVFPEKTNEDEIKSIFSKLIEDKNSDIIITMGLYSSFIAKKFDFQNKKTIIPFLIDDKSEENEQFSISKNISKYSIFIPFSIENEINFIKRVTLSENITIFAEPQTLEIIPQFIKDFISKNGIKISEITKDSLENYLKNLNSNDTKTDQIKNISNVNYFFYFSENNELTKILNQIAKKEPSFSYFPISSKEENESNIIGSFTTDKTVSQIFRRVAIIIDNAISQLPIQKNIKISHIEIESVLNMDLIRYFGLDLSWDIIAESDLINEEPKDIKKLSLKEAVEVAVTKNLDILLYMEESGLKDEAIREAKSNYFPKVELSATGLWIDKDRADASFGLYKEKSLSAGLKVTQLIYAEKALANIDIKSKLKDIDNAKVQQMKEDIAVETAQFYINFIRASVYEKILRQNIKLTYKNLEIAKLREQLGASGPGEIYRWESQLASDKKEILKALGQKKHAQTALNRLMNQPLENRVYTIENNLDDSGLLTSFLDINSYLHPSKFKILKNFMVKKGIEKSSELKQIELGIEAQKRYLKSVKTGFWSPVVALQGNISHRLWSNQETSSIDVPAGFESIVGGLIPETDKTEWSIALNVSLDIFDQGKKWIEDDKVSKEIKKLYLQQQSIQEKIEQRVRYCMDKTAVSYPTIKLSGDVYQTAQKSLKLITDAYSKGFTSISDLLDIQNKTKIAQEIAENAKYDFLLDLIDLQRAIGTTLFIIDEKSKKSWEHELKDYFEKSN